MGRKTSLMRCSGDRSICRRRHDDRWGRRTGFSGSSPSLRRRSGRGSLLLAEVHICGVPAGVAKAWKAPTASALCQARKRLGEAPVKELFEQVCQPLATTSTIGAFHHGWRLMAVDGLVWDVPDTQANDAEFGRPSSRTDQGGAFPQVRMVALGEAGTHAVAAAALGPVKTGARELAEGCLFAMEPGMLVGFDRGFYSFDFYRKVTATGADVLFRLSKTMRLPVLARLGDDSYLSVITPGRGLSRRPLRSTARNRWPRPVKRSSCGPSNTPSPTEATHHRIGSSPRSSTGRK